MSANWIENDLLEWLKSVRDYKLLHHRVKAASVLQEIIDYIVANQAKWQTTDDAPTEQVRLQYDEDKKLYTDGKGTIYNWGEPTQSNGSDKLKPRFFNVQTTKEDWEEDFPKESNGSDDGWVYWFQGMEQPKGYVQVRLKNNSGYNWHMEGNATEMHWYDPMLEAYRIIAPKDSELPRTDIIEPLEGIEQLKSLRVLGEKERQHFLNLVGEKVVELIKVVNNLLEIARLERDGGRG